MSNEILLPAAPVASTLKLTDEVLGTFASLTVGATSFEFDETNYAKKDTAILIFAKYADNTETKFILSKALSEEMYAGKIGFNNVVGLNVRAGYDEDGELVRVIARSAKRISIAANTVTAKPYASNIIMSDAELKALLNGSV